MNPLLDPLNLPDFTALTSQAIDAALDEGIEHHRAVVAELTAVRPTDFADAWLPYERAETMLNALWQAVSHLHAVSDTQELRAAYARGQTRLTENAMAAVQNRDLFEVFAAVAAAPSFAGLSTSNRAALERALRNFRLSGVALEPAPRERFREISIELSRLSIEFSNAVLDATDAWFEHITDPGRLNGLSDAAKAMFAAAAAQRSLDGWVVTLQAPSVVAVLTFAEDRELRARVYEAFGTRASDRGPHAGQFDNSQRIARTLELRREAAALLGYPDPVVLSLATKMAPGAAEVMAFLYDLAHRAKPAAERDLAEVAAYARDVLGISDLQPWDIGFVSSRLREARHAIDELSVREYFPVEQVVASWERLLDRLFGLRLVPRDNVALYHPDACFYDVADQSGDVIAGLYVDLHARSGKRSGAWMSESRARLDDGNSRQVPVANLVCNFAPVSEDMPSLLSHSDIVTLLHETGHTLHHLLSRVERPSVAGISGFEWDAIELPSQLMEDFAWDPEVLTGMSGHFRTGEALPGELFDRMLAARRFQSGLQLLRQLELSIFDIRLHLDTQGSDPIDILKSVREEVAVVSPPEWHRFPHSFLHIFANNYAAGYYSYLWAEVLAADGFQRFQEAGTVDRATGDAFVAQILSRGATRPAAESFRAFRGRDADPAAMLRRHGLAEEAQV